MKWLSKIRELLGKFWTKAFHGHEFILGVENLLAALGKAQQGKHDSWAFSHIAADTGLYNDTLPFPIYLEKSRLDKSTGTMVSAVEFPQYDINMLLDGRISASTYKEGKPNSGWILRSPYHTPQADYLTDHVVDYTRTFVAGMDYTMSGDRLLFYVDPASLDLPEVDIMDADGILHRYIKMFGWQTAHRPVNDMVSGIYSPRLSDNSAIVWRMHQLGGSVQDVKDLLASLSGSVVATEGGMVTDVWTEQDRRYICVDDKCVYGASTATAVNYSTGDTVQAGDTLMGSLRMVDGKYIEDHSVVWNPVLNEEVSEYVGGTHTVLSNGTVTSVNLSAGTVRVSYGQTDAQGNTLRIGTSILEVDEPSSCVCNYTANDIITVNDIVWSSPGADTFVGIMVRTDVGDLIARNTRATTTITVGNDNFNILPLQLPGSSTSYSAYADKCISLLSDSDCRTMRIPDVVNPFIFILQQLRKYRGLCISISAEDMPYMSDALSCIHDNTCASGIVTVYVRAATEPATLMVEAGTAMAARQAVSVVATAQIQEMCAEAGVTL